MKEKIIPWLFGAVGSIATGLFGGWTEAMSTLCIFMLIDYITGVSVALTGKSSKTESGKLSSKAGFIGLMKKAMIMIVMIVAYRLDLLIGTHNVKDTTCIAFVINEAVSIIENVSKFIDVPEFLTNIIENLKKSKGGKQ